MGKCNRTRLLVDDQHRLYVETASGHVDYPIRYHNGKVAWDRPEAVAPAIRRQAASRFNRAFMRGKPYANDCYEELRIIIYVGETLEDGLRRARAAN